MFDDLKKRGFQVLTLYHAEAILEHDMGTAARDLETALSNIRIPIEELVRGGGGEGELTQRIRNELADIHGWKKHNFEIKKVVDGKEKESTSHELDHVKTFGSWTMAMEIEWNNKDTFFDRDLENFKRLHGEGAISIGGIITRGETLQEGMREMIEAFARKRGIDSVEKLEPFDYLPTKRQRELIEKAVVKRGSFEAGWSRVFVADKFADSTTHWKKLEDRVRRGVGNPCPLLLVGIPRDVVVL